MKIGFLFFIGVFFTSVLAAQQTLHIHFDKDIYLPGETIWFKANLYENGASSAMSTNFYAAIYDENGALLQQKQYPVFDGSCNGDFLLEDTLLTKRIQFRAFTKAMLYTDSTNAYSKIIPVGSILSNTNESKAGTTLQFFPEGGTAVAGVPNYFGIKTSGSSKGRIVDEETRTEIDSFYTDSQGMGKVQFTPEFHKRYTAVWQQQGSTASAGLPPVKEYGITLHTEWVNNELYYTVFKNVDAGNFDTLHLLAQAGNRELYKADLLMKDKKQLVNKFNTASFPPGILQLTLFDIGWNAMQQKIVFVKDGGSRQQVAVTIKQKDLGAKGFNQVDIAVADTLLYDLSVAISDINFIDNNNRRSIEQDLLYGGQLLGVEGNMDEVIKNDPGETELLMLTHNWKKYPYSGVLQQSAKTGPADDYLALAFNYKNNKYKVPANDKLSLIIRDTASGKQFYNLDAFDQSSYRKSGLLFYDTAKVYYQFKNNKESSVDLQLFKIDTGAVPAKIAGLYAPAVNAAAVAPLPPQVLNAFKIPVTSKMDKAKVLQQVVVKSRRVNPITKRLEELDDKYASGMFRGISQGIQVNVLDDPTAWAQNDIFSYLRRYIAGLTRSTAGWGIRRGDEFLRPTFFVNEVETIQESVNNTSMSQVAYIKYIPGITIGSSFSTGAGAVYIYTKKGDEPGQVGSNTMRIANIKGYDLPKEFFTPAYAVEGAKLQPDNRATVYWNPYILLDKDHQHYTVAFYNNDLSKKLLLKIEGLNEKGELIHIEKVIE